MSEFDSSQALLFMGAGNQLQADLQHVYTSIDIAAAQGHNTEVDQLWLRTDRPVTVETGPDSHITSSVLTTAACVTLAQIELTRYAEVDEQLLSARERHMRELFGSLGLDFSHDVVRGGFADAMRGLGGVAVVAGTELAISMVAGNYEDLRQLGS